MRTDERELEDRARAGLAMSLAGYALDVPVGEVRLATRGATQASQARHVAMYLCHVAFGMSLARVAAAFRRDRSTVGHACHVMEDRRDDPRFDAWIEALETSVRAAPRPVIRMAAEG
jgi:chromosomal replication initiation ATPase DnaA